VTVSVVVPAFNNWPLTQACIAELLAATAPELLADVIVVDDGSTDGTSAARAAAQRSFTPVLLPHNSGFSVACNAGAAAGHGDMLLFLNNDAFAKPGSVAAMLAPLSGDPSIGIVGAKLLYADGSLQHAGLALLPGPVSRWWHVHRQLPGALPDADIARDLLAVTGAALMIRRSLFDELGGFDAAYTNGWEDVDLCLRAWSHGARVRYEPRAVMEHLESATLGRMHDDSANEARFVARWTATLAGAPRYRLAEIPPVALAGRSSAARDHLQRWWGAHFGASVRFTRPGSRVDRASVELGAALAKRRPTLEVSLAEATQARATGAVRAALVAPLTAAEARSYVTAPDIAAWWTPTAASFEALLAAGAPATRIALVPLGGAGAAPTPRTGAFVVGARDEDADVLSALHGRAGVATVLLRADESDFARIDLVVARRGGDRYGLLVPTALAHGCRVIVSPPLDTFVAACPGVMVVAEAELLAAVCEHVAEADHCRAGAMTVHLAASRRLHAKLATQRAAETARALMHGTPSSATVEVGPALAAQLRGAPLEVSA
jgi:GT2 family glycosyltransferase